MTRYVIIIIPSIASTTNKTPSVTLNAHDNYPIKFGCPGVSIKFSKYDFDFKSLRSKLIGVDLILTNLYCSSSLESNHL
jgi:hypothetical protein